MTVAIMQPYFFPYIGYFQLIAAVDKFIIYDDVNFINRGWINRNNILVSGAQHLIQVPLVAASQNKRINDIEIVKDDKWKQKLLLTIRHSYSKAPYFVQTNELLESLLARDLNKISELNVEGIISVCKYLDLKTDIIKNSVRYSNHHLKGQERILDICLKESAQKYLNPIGGIELYDKSLFKRNGIVLNFLKSKPLSYCQYKLEHVPWLSIIDVLMFNSKEEVNMYLQEFELI